MGIPNTPLFVKTHDFLLWLIRHTQRFPKNLRYTYTQRVEGAALEFQEAILMANSVRAEARRYGAPGIRYGDPGLRVSRVPAE